eukprot:4761705-Amphidinium_carterae.1
MVRLPGSSHSPCGASAPCHVDDAHIADLSTAKGAGQQLIHEVFALLGSPVAPLKRQPCVRDPNRSQFRLDRSRPPTGPG